MAIKQSNIIVTDRRRFLTGAASVTAAGFAAHLPMPAIAQGAPLKVGLMLPYSGTFAKLGKFVDDGFRLYVEQQGGKLGGRPVIVRAGRRRVEAGGGHRQHEPPRRPREGRCRGRHRPLRRRHGDGESRPRHQHHAGHSERRRQRGDRPDVLTPHLPHLVLELAAVLPDGQGDVRRRPPQCRDHHLALCGRHTDGRCLQGGLHQGWRQDRRGSGCAVPRSRVPGADHAASRP